RAVMRGNGLIAAGLSALVPGLGQGYLGRWRRAALLAAPVGLIAVAGWYVLDLGTFDVLGFAVRPIVLKTVLVVNLAIVVWRVFAVVDAFALSRSPRAWWRVTIVVLLALTVAAPHAIVTQYTLDAAHALDEVFVADTDTVAGTDEPVVVEPITIEPDDPSVDDEILPPPDPKLVVSRYPRRSDGPLVYRDGIGDPDAVREARRFATTGEVTDQLGEDLEGIERITVLLVGGDGGPGRSGSRADSINVASIDTTTGKAAVFGIPRNMTHVPLPDAWSTAFVELEQRLTPWDERKTWTDEDDDGIPDQFVPCHCFPDQINAIYPFTRGWTETYPDERDPGLAALRDVLEILLGIHIDYYAFVDMRGFVRVVNALGGVNVFVRSPVTIEMSPAEEGEPWHEAVIGSGWQRLNGLDALAYVRERKTTSDYVRMQRQRCMLKAVAARATPGAVLARFSALARAMSNSVRTDIDIDYLPRLLEETASLDFGDIATVGFVPPFYTPIVDFRGKPTPDLARIQAMVRWAFSADESTEFDTGQDSECRV
ncbi:MAG: LCP family protein, partial [Acidimicrobiia bacterium]|nr:LCP family protein [Acidimicrobiia bacterium]